MPSAGFSLVEFLIASLIAAFIGMAALRILSGFFQNGAEFNALAQRTMNADATTQIANHLLAQAGYVGPSVAETTSSPQIVDQYGYAEGVTIQWWPYVGSATPVECTGTLVDHSLYPLGSTAVNGLLWTVNTSSTAATASVACPVGQAFFPVGNQWGFTLTTAYPGCPNQQQAVLLTNNYAYGANQQTDQAHGATVQEVAVCLPNVS